MPSIWLQVSMGLRIGNPGEDIIAISNYDGKLKDLFLTQPYEAAALRITGDSLDVLIFDTTVKEVKSMIVFGDPLPSYELRRERQRSHG
jgi:hypothetical protein